MTPKNSDYSSDESQPSEMEVDIPFTRSDSDLNNTDIISPPPSSVNSLISPSGSSIASSSESYCDNHNPNKRSRSEVGTGESCVIMGASSEDRKSASVANENDNKFQRDTVGSVSSLSVPSSPEPTVSPQNDSKQIKTTAFVYGSHQRFSYPDLPPRTAPCIVLSPSTTMNPHLFNHNNLSTYNHHSSSLIVPVLPFQMFHHHQSTLMSKINPLCFKSAADVGNGMQRIRDFCTDHNFNSLGTNLNNNNNDDEATVMQQVQKKDSKGMTLNSYEKKETRERQEQGNDDDGPPKEMKRLSFGIDAILSEGKPLMNKSYSGKNNGKRQQLSSSSSPSPRGALEEQDSNDPISKRSLASPTAPSTRQPILYQNPHANNHHHHQHDHSHHQHNHHRLSTSSLSTPNHQIPLNLTSRGCTDCYLLGRYCRNNGTTGNSSNNLHFSSLVSSSNGMHSMNGGGGGNGGSSNGVSSSFSPWISNASMYENSPLLSPSAYHTQSTLTSAYNLGNANYSTMSSLVSCNNGPGGRRKRSWSRAVFSSLQRKGLEKRFQIQKYITKPDRRQLAATLGLTDAQVKVWFQNRRMKWRHSKEGKVTSGVGDEGLSVCSSTVIPSTTTANNKAGQTSQQIGIGTLLAASVSAADIDVNAKK